MALTNKLTAIADAIRTKTGKTDTMTLEQMVTEISSISVGTGEGGSSNITMSFDSATGVLTINEV